MILTWILISEQMENDEDQHQVQGDCDASQDYKHSSRNQWEVEVYWKMMGPGHRVGS